MASIQSPGNKAKDITRVSNMAVGAFTCSPDQARIVCKHDDITFVANDVIMHYVLYPSHIKSQNLPGVFQHWPPITHLFIHNLVIKLASLQLVSFPDHIFLTHSTKRNLNTRLLHNHAGDCDILACTRNNFSLDSI